MAGKWTGKKPIKTFKPFNRCAPFKSFQWFHRSRGANRNHSRSFAKEISPMGAGVNASRRGSRFNGSNVQRRTLAEERSSGSNRSTASLRSSSFSVG